MNACCPGYSPEAMTRRGFLAHAAAGILAASPAARALAAAERKVGYENPLAPRAPHFPGRAKQVIMLYMSGAFGGGADDATDINAAVNIETPAGDGGGGQ